MKIGLEFDVDGNYVCEFVEGNTLPEGHQFYEGEPPEGSFQYMPRLVNGAIVEALTQAEIDAIVNAPKPKTELEIMKESAAQQSADFQAFMDNYYSKNPE